MHFTCGVITPNGSRTEIEALLAPHQEEYDETADELNGWWDWYQVGGRWPRKLITSGDGWMGELSWSWSRPTVGDSDYISARMSLWTDRHVDSCPIKAIDWDAMGAHQIAELRQDYRDSDSGPFDRRDRSVSEDEFIKRYFQPFSVFRLLLPDGETEVSETWNDEAKGFDKHPDFPGRIKTALAEHADSHWLTIVDYHS